MATTPTGLDVPAGTDVFDPDGDLRALAASLTGRVIVPVPNATARDALAAALPPGLAAPLFVWRADTKALEGAWDATGWKPLTASATLRVLITEANGYTEGDWGAMPLASTPVASQTDDPYSVLSIDAVTRRVMVSQPGLYLVTSRVGNKPGTGTPNTSQRILANGGIEAEGRMPSDLGTTTLSTQVRLAAGQGIDVQTYRYTGSANVTLSGHLHVTRISA